jgi:hypothetical protein
LYRWVGRHLHGNWAAPPIQGARLFPGTEFKKIPGKDRGSDKSLAGIALEKGDPPHEEDTDIGVHRWCDYRRTWGGIRHSKYISISVPIPATRRRLRATGTARRLPLMAIRLLLVTVPATGRLLAMGRPVRTIAATRVDEGTTGPADSEPGTDASPAGLYRTASASPIVAISRPVSRLTVPTLGERRHRGLARRRLPRLRDGFFSPASIGDCWSVA